jgi:hypothetical protein
VNYGNKPTPNLRNDIAPHLAIDRASTTFGPRDRAISANLLLEGGLVLDLAGQASPEGKYKDIALTPGDKTTFESNTDNISTRYHTKTIGACLQRAETSATHGADPVTTASSLDVMLVSALLGHPSKNQPKALLHAVAMNLIPP